MKKLLYIDHSFHNKTKSAQFLCDILRTAYEMEVCDFDPYSQDPECVFEQFKGKHFDVLVLFQIMPDLVRLKANVSYDHAALFPMFDGSGGLEDQAWEPYRDFNIINFSKTLHERLLGLGFSSYYIQYFPKPYKDFKYGSPTHVYFWQRVTSLNLSLVEKLLKNIVYDKIHLHKVLDPGHSFKAPSPQVASKIEISDWYETRDEMLKDIESCGIYIAPRPYEGIGMSFLEAMAMGRCVIAPDNPTMNEYIIHGENGLLYDFYSPHSIKETAQIEKIQQNAYKYIQCGYEKWEVDKYKILTWLETPVHISSSKTIKKKYYLKVKSYYLFCFIPFIVIKDVSLKKRYYDLFGSIRLLRCKLGEKGIKFYLFGLIPIWKIRY